MIRVIRCQVSKALSVKTILKTLRWLQLQLHKRKQAIDVGGMGAKPTYLQRYLHCTRKVLKIQCVCKRRFIAIG